MIAFLFIASLAAGDPQAGSSDDLSRALKEVESGNAEKCRAGNADEVVVCGTRSQKYRIDRDVLQASRAKNANPPKASPSAQAMAEMRYGNSQDVGRIIPMDVKQMPVGKAVLAAINGGDWRDGFAGPPGEYEVLEAERATPTR